MSTERKQRSPQRRLALLVALAAVGWLVGAAGSAAERQRLLVLRHSRRGGAGLVLRSRPDAVRARPVARPVTAAHPRRNPNHEDLLVRHARLFVTFPLDGIDLREPRLPGGRLRSCPPERAAPVPPPLLRCAGHPPSSPPHPRGAPPSNTPVVSGSGRWGALRSEVKEEGRAQPGPGDMSGAERPAGLIPQRYSRTDVCPHRCPHATAHDCRKMTWQAPTPLTTA